MSWWHYLIPDNPVALAIWCSLLIVFASWVCLFILECLRLRKNKKDLSSCERVEALEASLKRRVVWTNGNAKEHQTEIQSNEELNDALTDFYLTAGIESEAVLVDHIRAIFEAGWNNSQLQIESLMKNTANRLFRRTGVLRSLLSLFIIVGLLGTLFGLAHSLAQLLPFAPNSSRISDASVASGLIDLLTQLRSAFAPSIWGVALTIVGVLCFSLYLYRCQLLRDEVGRLTLTVWVPKLYPSPFQQQLITLIQTEELIRQNKENIRTVADFAKNIRSDVEDFGSEMQKAKTTVKNLNKSSAQISDFADKFHAGVERLTPFQADLAQLYRKIMEDSKVFQEGVSKSLFDTTETQKQARDTLTQQSQQLKEIIEGLLSLLSYEGAYVRSREELDSVLRTVMEDARKAYQGIGERNQEIAVAINESLSIPLREDLATKLGEVNETLGVKLGSIVERFDRFDAPIKTAAEKFEQLVGNIISQAGELMARLQQEYNKQNEANVEQLDKLEGLNSQVVSFLESLTGVTSKQETSYAKLSAALPNVEAKLTTLTEYVRSLAATPYESGMSVDTAGIEREIRDNTSKLLTELDKLVTIAHGIRSVQVSTDKHNRVPPAHRIETRQDQYERSQNTARELKPEKVLVRAAGVHGSSTTGATYSRNDSPLRNQPVNPAPQTTKEIGFRDDSLGPVAAHSAKEPDAPQIRTFTTFDDYSKAPEGYVSRVKNKLKETTSSLRDRILRR